MAEAQRNLRTMTEEVLAIEARLREGGGAARIEKQHRDGKLTARERVAALLDPQTSFTEVGLLVAYDKYDGAAPGMGVVTGFGTVEGRPVVVVANDATVKAGAWWPETITKILRAQEIAMRNRTPIVYLVDSAGVNLPLQDGIFPGQYGAARIFYYNSLMRRRLRIPQIAAVMGSCVAGGAYLPALSDVIVMVEGVSFMGLGGPNLVKGAIGQVTDAETLGGARMHTSVSGVAHYRAANDEECITIVRRQVKDLPAASHRANSGTPPKAPPDRLYEVLPADHRLPYRMEDVLDCLLDSDDLLEFQPEFAPEYLCATAHLGGRVIGLMANRRGFLKTAAGPRVGGILYAESARKAAYFADYAERRGMPILYVEDVSGFMVGTAAESDGIIRAGAEMVEAMACASVPKVVLVVNHASGAGYYAMAGQGFDPNFIFSLPTARVGVMEGDSAVQAIYGKELEKARTPELEAKIAGTRADYDRWLDAKYGAARAHCDAIIAPDEARDVLIAAFDLACAYPGGEHVPVQLMA